MAIGAFHTDIQGAFLPGGALGAPGRDKVIGPSVKLSRDEAIARVLASRDKHKPDSMSFNIWPRDEQGRTVHPRLPHDAPGINMWPPHGIEDTPEAEIDPQILAVTDRVIDKGMDRDVEQYSGATQEAIDDFQEHGVSTVIVTGLCTDYCVKNSAIDFAKAGFNVVVPLDCIQGVEVNPGDCARAIETMEAAGVHIAETWEQAIEIAQSMDISHSL